MFDLNGVAWTKIRAPNHSMSSTNPSGFVFGALHDGLTVSCISLKQLPYVQAVGPSARVCSLPPSNFVDER